MTSDSGFTSQHIDYPQAIQEVFDYLHQMQRKPTLATSPQDLEALERDIRQHTDHLGSLLVGHHLQHSLDADALQAEPDQLVSQWPKPLKNDGRVKVWVHTAQGGSVPVWVTSYRHKGKRRAGKRYPGLYAGLVLLGIDDRCTPALAAEISLLAAMLGSLEEAQDVLAERGVELDPKTVRLIAYRYATRARLEQQIESTSFEDSVAGRRVVVSSDGGRIRLRERVPLLVQALGLAAEQVHERLDFYHAAQHLAQVVALRKDWSAKDRSRWRNQQRRLLLQGEVKRVIAAVRDLCRGRNSKSIRTHRDYFIKNESRMAYAKLTAMKLPIGSGAIESTVRRVVNLRLQGASLFGCRASAEAILLLRSYYKAGRWNLLKRMATSHQALIQA
jgi:hypothetical protein